MASGTGIGEFFISLSVDAAEGALTVGNLVQSFGALEVATVAEIGLLWEMGVLLARVTDEGIKAALGFEQFSMHTGLSAQALQKWQIVAEQSHASAQDVTGSVESLTKHLANLAVGIPDAALGSLQQLGISAFGAGGKLKDAFQILSEVRLRLGAITSDAGQQERILSGLGVSPNLRETLLLTDQRFNALAGTAHGMTAAQEASFDAMRGHFVTIELVAKDISRDIGAWVADLDKASGALSKVEAAFKAIRDVVEGKYKIFEESPAQKAIDERERKFFADIFNPNPRDRSAREQIQDWFPRLFGSSVPALSPEPAGGFRAAAPTTVHIDKHDTYNIHDAHDPSKVKEVIEQHWDDVLGRKTVDGFDRQLNNGGY